METDRAKFPPAERLSHLCGVRVEGKEGFRFKLGFVDYVPDDPEEGAAHLVADTFDLAINQSQLERRYEITERPGKKPIVHTRYYVSVKGRMVPVTDLELEPVPIKIAYEVIVSVCVMLIRRRIFNSE